MVLGPGPGVIGAEGQCPEHESPMKDAVGGVGSEGPLGVRLQARY